MSPNAKAALRTQWKVTDSPVSVWAAITNPMSSGIVNTDHVFFGQFNQMTIGIFGDAADVIVDSFSDAQSAMVRIIASLYCDVAIRLPRAFGIARETAPPLSAKSESKLTPKSSPVAPPPAPVPVEPKEPESPPSTAAEPEVRANNPDNGPGNKKNYKSPFR